MKKIALDTNAYRAFLDGNPQVVAYIQSASQLGLPVVVLGELYYGVFLSSKNEKNQRDLNGFLASPRVELLHINEETAKLFGEIAVGLRLKGKVIQQDDMWIAALCKQYDYPLVTADKGFSEIIGLEVIGFSAHSLES